MGVGHSIQLQSIHQHVTTSQATTLHSNRLTSIELIQAKHTVSDSPNSVSLATGKWGQAALQLTCVGGEGNRQGGQQLLDGRALSEVDMTQGP